MSVQKFPRLLDQPRSCTRARCVLLSSPRPPRESQRREEEGGTERGRFMYPGEVPHGAPSCDRLVRAGEGREVLNGRNETASLSPIRQLPVLTRSLASEAITCWRSELSGCRPYKLPRPHSYTLFLIITIGIYFWVIPRVSSKHMD
jgi:hypothetical protein